MTAAFGWYQKAAEQGHAKAQYFCGYMLRQGEGVAQDQTAALGWLRKAAEQGDVGAQYFCGEMVPSWRRNILRYGAGKEVAAKAAQDEGTIGEFANWI